MAGAYHQGGMKVLLGENNRRANEAENEKRNSSHTAIGTDGKDMANQQAKVPEEQKSKSEHIAGRGNSAPVVIRGPLSGRVYQSS